MTYVMVDVEADGPCPGIYSMIALGAVVVDKELKTTFKALIRPMTSRWVPEALAVSGYTRAQVMEFPDAESEIVRFDDWLSTIQNPMFVSDNNGFDWQFVNYYFHEFMGRNRFGFSSTNLGSLYKGVVCDMRKNFKHLRKTRHTHDPLDDAMGNAEAMLTVLGMLTNKGREEDERRRTEQRDKARGQ